MISGSITRFVAASKALVARYSNPVSSGGTTSTKMTNNSRRSASIVPPGHAPWPETRALFRALTLAWRQESRSCARMQLNFPSSTPCVRGASGWAVSRGAMGTPTSQVGWTGLLRLCCGTAEAAPVVSEPYTHPQRLVAVEGTRRLNLYCLGRGTPVVLFNSDAEFNPGN